MGRRLRWWHDGARLLGFVESDRESSRGPDPHTGVRMGSRTGSNTPRALCDLDEQVGRLGSLKKALPSRCRQRSIRQALSRRAS